MSQDESEGAAMDNDATPHQELPSGVFISYQRSSGAFLARAVYQYLKQEDYDVFLDVEQVNSGRFENVILNQLGSRDHVLVILTPNAAAAIRSPSDWVRREIERAFTLEKNVVPIFAEGARATDLSESGDETLARLRQTNGLTVTAEYFDAAMRVLTERFLQQPTLQELRFKTAEEHYDGSVAARESGDWVTAERELAKAIELNPGRPDYFQNRAAVRVTRDNMDGALLDINQAIGLDPTSQQLAIHRFHIQQAMDRLEDALSSYRQWAQSNGVWENDLPF
jgi:tetratricopeptide (TPR) repeat protein